MNLPLYDNGAAAGLLAGILFGFVLENAGFGSARKLTGQFRLSDWSVFKVMFTAVIVSAIGLWLLQLAGLTAFSEVYIPTPFYWGMALGGILLGAGFAIGGYCPGTSAVGLAGGRGDALVFILGMIVGTAVFAGVFPVIEPLYNAAQGAERQTLQQLFGVPTWGILVALVAVMVAGFLFGTSMERRSAAARRSGNAPTAGAPSAAE